MENLSLVAAIGKNNELGIDNHLIWKISEDLKFYRSLTLHKNIIMGRKTLESMPEGALKGRTINVLSSSPLDKVYDVNVFNSIESMLEYVRISNREFIVVGGASIYSEFLSYVDTMYLTLIDDYANADTFFPYIDYNDWEIEMLYSHYKESYDNRDVSYVRNKYVRRRKV